MFEQLKRVKFFINGQNFENLALRAGNGWIQDFRLIENSLALVILPSLNSVLGLKQ